MMRNEAGIEHPTLEAKKYILGKNNDDKLYLYEM